MLMARKAEAAVVIWPCESGDGGLPATNTNIINTPQRDHKTSKYKQTESEGEKRVVAVSGLRGAETDAAANDFALKRGQPRLGLRMCVE